MYTPRCFSYCSVDFFITKMCYKVWVKGHKLSTGEVYEVLVSIPWVTGCLLFTLCGLFVPAGGLQAVAELLQVDCEMFGLSSDHYSVTLRRYAGMALTNLTFGDVANKVGGKHKHESMFLNVWTNVCVSLTNQITALCCLFHQATLCSMKGCMRAMVAQLKSDSEDLQQVNSPVWHVCVCEASQCSDQVLNPLSLGGAVVLSWFPRLSPESEVAIRDQMSTIY